MTRNWRWPAAAWPCPDRRWGGPWNCRRETESLASRTVGGGWRSLGECGGGRGRHLSPPASGLLLHRQRQACPGTGRLSTDPARLVQPTWANFVENVPVSCPFLIIITLWRHWTWGRPRAWSSQRCRWESAATPSDCRRPWGCCRAVPVGSCCDEIAVS